MSKNNQKYLTVKEAVEFTGKSEKTIRQFIKKLLESKNTSGSLPEVFTEIKGKNKRQFHKISLLSIEKAYNVTSSKLPVILPEVETLMRIIESQEKQIENLNRLLENQQKMTMYGQLQLEKLQLSLEQKEIPKSKKFLWFF